MSTSLHEAGHAVARLMQDEIPLPPPIVAVGVYFVPEGWGGFMRTHGRRQFNFAAPMDELAPEAWELFSPESKQAAWHAAIEYLAGPAAQFHHLGLAEDVTLDAWPATAAKAWREARNQQAEDGVLQDWTAAAVHLWVAGRGLDVSEAWFEAVDLMLAHWPAVDALARALRRRGEIAGKEVQRIVVEALPRCSGTGGWLGRLA